VELSALGKYEDSSGLLFDISFVFEELAGGMEEEMDASLLES